MLKFSLCSSNLYANSVISLITNDLSSLSGKSFISVSLAIQGVCLVLSFGVNSFVFSFCLAPSVSVKLGGTVTNCSLEETSLHVNSPRESMRVQRLQLDGRV